MKNWHLQRAKKEANDEYYTKLFDVIHGLNPVRSQFKNKSILLSCADMGRAFHRYFEMNFIPLQLKELIVFSRTGRILRIWGRKREVLFNQSGSFDNKSFWTKDTIVVTNPPFSSFKYFVSLHADNNIPFIILGSLSALGYAPIRPLVRKNLLITRFCMGREFRVPRPTEPFTTYSDGYYKHLANTCWFYYRTIPPDPEELSLSTVIPPKLDNYPALYCKSVSSICDTPYPQAVPMNYLCYHNPERFTITDYLHEPILHGRKTYKRYIIQRN